MPRGGGGGRSGGGGGYRGSGGYRGRAHKSDDKSHENGHYTYGTPYTGSAGSRAHGSYSDAGASQSAKPASPAAGLNDDDWARAHSSTSPFGPATQSCTSKFKELRACIEANGGRTDPCSWYLLQWRACEEKSSKTSSQLKTKRK